jgi:CAAX protease family protein
MTSAPAAPKLTTRTQESSLTSVAAPRSPTTNPLRAFVRRHPVLTFYALTFAISWSGILLVIGGPANFPGTGDQIQQLFLPVMLAWLAGPSVASIVMTGLISGRAGYRDLLARLLRWRVGARWYAVALLSAPLIYVALCLALSPISSEFNLGILVTSNKAALVLMGLAYGLLGGGFLEELGWTGFAVPALRRGHGPIATALIAGVLWGAYHFSVIYWATTPSASGALALAILLGQLLAWLPAYRLLMVWVYERTQSLLLAMLMHASLAAGMLILQPLTLGGMSLLAWLVAFAAAWWVIVAAVAWVNRGHSWGHETKADPDRGPLASGGETVVRDLATP